MPARVAINGFGRVGRAAFRVAHDRGADLELVAIDDLADGAQLARLLWRGTVYGPFGADVELGDEMLCHGSPGAGGIPCSPTSRQTPCSRS